MKVSNQRQYPEQKWRPHMLQFPSVMIAFRDVHARYVRFSDFVTRVVIAAKFPLQWLKVGQLAIFVNHTKNAHTAKCAINSKETKLTP